MSTTVAPVTPELIAEDFSGLRNAFIQAGEAFLSAEALNVFALHLSAQQMLNLGWLRRAKGRWSNGFAPAGALAKSLEVES